MITTTTIIYVLASPIDTHSYGEDSNFTYVLMIVLIPTATRKNNNANNKQCKLNYPYIYRGGVRSMNELERGLLCHVINWANNAE